MQTPRRAIFEHLPEGYSDVISAFWTPALAGCLDRMGPLLVAAWLRLAGQTHDVEEKKRCLWAILDLDNTRALLGLLALVLEEAHD